VPLSTALVLALQLKLKFWSGHASKNIQALHALLQALGHG